VEPIRRESSYWTGGQAGTDQTGDSTPLHCQRHGGKGEAPTVASANAVETGLTDSSQNVQNGQFRKLQLARNGFGVGKSMDVKKRIQMLTVHHDFKTYDITHLH
jgi:hypothetical protein